jgi:hypothetical protein
MPIRNLEVLAPTRLEYWALRAVRPPAAVRRCGVGLTDWAAGRAVESIVTCGLAGSLLPGVGPGTVHIPELVRDPDGHVVRCDARLRTALVRGARALGFNPETGPLFTADTLVTGPARDGWAQRGFVVADMETGLVARRVARFATVRVVLDTPRRSISDHWLAPSRTALRPSVWPELLWLSFAAPRYALRAARVLNAGLVAYSSHSDSQPTE